MNPLSSSSSSPNLQLKRLIIGSKGLNILGNKQDSPNFWYTLDLNVEIGFVIFDILFKTGDNLFFTFPSGITGLPHPCWYDVAYADCLEMAETSGSLKRIAVAGTVLGIRNVPGSDDEKTAKTVAPVIPDARNVTSAPTSGFWKNKICNLQLY